MPNLATHINFGLETINGLHDDSMKSHLGNFLLGCCTPDIRALTKWERTRTHFSSLEVKQIGAGVEGLFRSNPQLTVDIKSHEPTRAFIAGYITHLIADETWIIEIYRPYFANENLFPDPIQANVADRAIQLDMDRAVWNERPTVDYVIDQINQSNIDIDITFIDANTMSDWRTWVAHFISTPFSWDRLTFLTQRMYKNNHAAQEVAQSFLASIDYNLELLYESIPRTAIQEFKDKVISESTRVIRERLYVC